MKTSTAVIIAAVVAAVVAGSIGYIVKPTPAGLAVEPPRTSIIHGLDPEYPPYTEVNPAGEAEGFDVDIIDWIADYYGWTVEHKGISWDVIVTALKNGDCDVIASGMTITPERCRVVRFTIPYQEYIHQLIVPATCELTKDEILNSGKSISCQLGATSDEKTEWLLSQGYDFTPLKLGSYTTAFAAISQGKAIAAISDSAYTTPNLKKFPDLKVFCTIGGPEYYGYAVRETDHWLLDKLNDGLAELMASPDWDELKEKWGLE